MVAIKDMAIPSCCVTYTSENDNYTACPFYKICEQRETIKTNYKPNNCPLEEVYQDNNCISRRTVLDLIDTCNSDGLKGIFCSYDDGYKFKKYIEELPTIIPIQTDSDDCVNRQSLLVRVSQAYEYANTKEELAKVFKDTIKALPSAKPTNLIAEVKFNKEELREICKERIAIECTHGTCKDCKRGQKCEHGVYCTNLNRTNEESWYCADFEKRGDSDGSN